MSYKGFRLKGEADPLNTVSAMCRDATWGTHVERLTAAAASCGGDAEKRWKSLEARFVADAPAPFETFKLSFPDQNFSIAREGVDHLLSTVAGDVVLHRDIEAIEVDDIRFEGDEYSGVFPGPNVGVEELYARHLRHTLKGIERPILAFTVKPRRGLSLEDLKVLYGEAASGGIDIVEDDERLVDPPECGFEERVRALAELQDHHEALYSPNITGDSETALRRLELCHAAGIRIVKVDVLVCGFDVLRKVAIAIKERFDSQIAITVYPDAYRAYRRLSRRSILKLARLCGADIIYAGSPSWGRYEPTPGSVRDAIQPIHTAHRMLVDQLELPAIKGTLATITNDQHPARAELLTAAFRHYQRHTRYGFFVGGGISGFPSKVGDACRVLRECVEHAAVTALEGYEPYDFGKFDASLREIGWMPLDVAQVLR